MVRNISEWINTYKVRVAVGALLLLAVALVVIRNPMLAVGAAILAGALVLLKDILAGVGTAQAADALNKIEGTAKDTPQSRADIERSKRNYDVWSSICGMFAAILGVPAAVSVVEQLTQ